MAALTMDEFLARLADTRKRRWRLDGQRLRCDGLCPIEIVFPQLRNAFNADDEGLLNANDQMKIIDAADNGFSYDPDPELRRKLIAAVGLRSK